MGGEGEPIAGGRVAPAAHVALAAAVVGPWALRAALPRVLGEAPEAAKGEGASELEALAATLPWALPLIGTSALTVYCGSKRSVWDDEEEEAPEAITTSEAMKFPFVGSAVLFSLFLCFKFLPKEWINTVLAIYFVVLGVAAITSVLYPFVEPVLPEWLASKQATLKVPSLPYVNEGGFSQVLDGTSLLLGALSSAFCLYYYFSRHWLANNILGVCFAIEGIEMIPLGSVKNGCILLAGLFFYDIFWVFCTPVMVTVAKSFDAPIKLLFPRLYYGYPPEGEALFSMLGLGDIVLPGLFVALMYRYDLAHAGSGGYFKVAMVSYGFGLAITLVVMTVFQAAQPALLWIVPSVLGAVLGAAAVRGELKEVFEWEEDPPEEGEEEGAEGPAGGDGDGEEVKKDK